MTQEEIKKLADTCVDALEEVPNGFEITTAILAVHCGYDASKK